MIVMVQRYSNTLSTPLGAQPNPGMIMTQPGNLKCKNILHLVGQTDPVKIKKVVKEALQMCVKNSHTSVAFPAIGTGEIYLAKLGIKLGLQSVGIKLGLYSEGSSSDFHHSKFYRNVWECSCMHLIHLETVCTACLVCFFYSLLFYFFSDYAFLPCCRH